MWHFGNWEYVSHPDSSKVVTRFKKRTALIGDLQKHDCSLKIDEVKVDDTGPFCFRFDVPGIVKGSYFKHEVLIHITDSPDVPSINCLPELKAGVDLAVTCSVPHTCLTNPPIITWSYTNGTFAVYHNKTGNGAWQVYSVLKFIPLASDHKSRLTCTAKYWGGKQADASVLLNVTYRPKNVNIEYKESRVKEGASIDLRCASDSYPPASSYQWYNVIGDQTLRLPQTSATIYVQNVSRKSRAFFCTSQNSEGLTNSTTVRLNVEYKPEILSESACTLDITGQLTCQCIVDSIPPPEIEWRISGSNLNESNTGLKSFSINNSRGQQNTVTKVLQGWVPFTGILSCSATNTQGKASMSFKRPMSDSPDVPSINCLPELKAGVDLAVTCSVPHTCLTNPPIITWSYTNGTFAVYHNKTGNGAWQVYSVLKFIPLASDHKSRLTCTAKYWGGKQADASVLLNVTYRPKNVNIEYKESRVKEGASIDLRCASDSYPPASSYQWYNVIGDQTLRLPQTSATIYVQNVSRKSRAFFCTSQNSEGLTNSTTVRLNVEYKPEILSESACTLDITGQLTCQCIVDSIPPPEIEWRISGSNLNESNTGLKSFSINNRRGQQNTVTKVLQGWVPFTGILSCSATNTQGKASMSFKRPMSGMVLTI
ncbi:Sialic acid-binding Ig-like lectin 5 [Acipenser ruthenus]|uniref:Sialic acid-binding Ig-like lectin 5 n=1 Tax=Acipenser ruthenus TaxID=7906 RepID=A0A444U0T0_ACIRT|nr:Sialic acid-binding Ig-like lectin 5 [Acipenser ruthenus]